MAQIVSVSKESEICQDMANFQSNFYFASSDVFIFVQTWTKSFYNKLDNAVFVSTMSWYKIAKYLR
jgi:hypothetical protein